MNWPPSGNRRGCSILCTPPWPANLSLNFHPAATWRAGWRRLRRSPSNKRGSGFWIWISASRFISFASSCRTNLTSEEALRNLLLHHLHKSQRTDSDRDKIDFLLVQYFSHCAPSRLEDRDVDMEYVTQVLEPVLGAVDLTLPEWIKPLDELLNDANSCKGLNELLTSRILEKGRKLKTSGEDYFVPAAMVAFTRFSFLIRRIFFRLMHQDLNGILDGLRQLEGLGVKVLDCRRAQFSAEEPIARLRMICQSWKVMFHAEYSSGQPLRMLVDLRSAVDNALARAANKTDAVVAGTQPLRARAAAAAAGAPAGATSSQVREFEVKPQSAEGNEYPAAADGSGEAGE